MPTIPNKTDLNATSVDILNAINNGASDYYQSMVPYAVTGDIASIRSIGEIINNYTPIKNEFLGALVNRIGRVLIESKPYDNPWAMFKRGQLEYGETVEEIFVNIATPYNFNPELAVTNQYAREIPDVRSAFHSMNYQKFYKTTVSNEQLRQAFLSFDGVTNLISGIIEALVTSANTDEFLAMKYLIAKMALNGAFKPVTIPALTADNANEIVTEVKNMSNLLTFQTDAYNYSGVTTHTSKRDQILLVSSQFDAINDVNVLARAYNIDNVLFAGQWVLVNQFGFSDGEISRLNELFDGDPNYEEIGSSDNDVLNAIPAIMVDRSWFMIFDNFTGMTDKYNGEGLYWNYWYHVWKTFSASPFANALIMTTTAPSVTSVTCSPKAVSAVPNSTTQVSANVVTAGFASKDVTWTISGGTGNSTVDSNGLVHIAADETNETVLAVKATSVVDSGKSDTCNITIVGATA